MKYTFSAIIRPSAVAMGELEALQKEWTRRTIEPILVSGQPTEYWRVTRDHYFESFPNMGDWDGFYSGGPGLGALCHEWGIIELGIVFSPARFSFSIPGPGMNRKDRGSQGKFCITEEKGLYSYDVRSGVDGVSDGAVGIFLTRKQLNGSWDGNGENDIDFKYWNSFYVQAHDFDLLLRALRKLDQLRGTRKNSGAFERLSAEISELVCSII